MNQPGLAVYHASRTMCAAVLVEAAEGEDAMVIQAGVWALTDGYSRQRIQVTLRTRRVSTRYGVPLSGLSGTDEGPAISNIQIDKAKQSWSVWVYTTTCDLTCIHGNAD